MGAQIELFAGPPVKSHGLTETDIDEMFARFWEVYPRHEAKKDARKAYRQVIGDTTEAEIIEGTRRYVAAIESRGVQSVKFVLLPATFLRGERYRDDFGHGARYERAAPSATQHSSFAKSAAHFAHGRGIHRRAVPTLRREARVVFCRWRGHLGTRQT